MLDIRLLRSEPDFVKARLTSRGADATAVDKVLDLDTHWRAVRSEAEGLPGEKLQRQRSKTSGAAGSVS